MSAFRAWYLAFAWVLMGLPCASDAAGVTDYDASVSMQFSQSNQLETGDEVELELIASNAGTGVTPESMVSVYAPPLEVFALRFMRVEGGTCSPFDIDLAPVTWNINWQVPSLTAGQSFSCTVVLEVTEFIPISGSLLLSAYYLYSSSNEVAPANNEDLVTLNFGGAPAGAIAVPALHGHGRWLLVLALALASLFW